MAEPYVKKSGEKTYTALRDQGVTKADAALAANATTDPVVKKKKRAAKKQR